MVQEIGLVSLFVFRTWTSAKPRPMAFGNPVGNVLLISMCMQNFSKIFLLVPELWIIFTFWTSAKHRLMENGTP